MAYRLEAVETVEEGVRRVALEQIDKLLGELHDETLDVHARIHQARKRCKKLRALVRLVRPVVPDLYEHENAVFRDAARTLSDARDATALIETYDALMDHYADEVDRTTFGPLRALLTRRRGVLMDEQDGRDRLADFEETIRAARDRVPTWAIPDDGFEAVRGGLAKTYGRAYRALRVAYDEPSDEAFHEWRKRAKYHRYHTKLLRNLWPRMVNARRHALNDLTDLLGDDHDLAEFAVALDAERETFAAFDHMQALLGLMDRRRGELQTRAHALGLRLFADEPDAFADRYGVYWRAWEREQEADIHRAAPIAAPA